MTEQSSTSKTENPKHKNALTEKYKEETEKLPKPTAIAVEEWLEGKVYHRTPETE